MRDKLTSCCFLETFGGCFEDQVSWPSEATPLRGFSKIHHKERHLVILPQPSCWSFVLPVAAAAARHSGDLPFDHMAGTDLSF